MAATPQSFPGFYNGLSLIARRLGSIPKRSEEATLKQRRRLSVRLSHNKLPVTLLTTPAARAKLPLATRRLPAADLSIGGRVLQSTAGSWS